MSDPDYEYRGWMARAWDDLRGDTSDWSDRHAYLEVIREHGEPVLDVGCGTGRLLLDYAALGIDVDGVDNSPEMLALLRQRAEEAGLDVRVYEQPMQALDLPRRYRVILVPSSSFQLLVEPADAAAAMRRFHDHVEPGGVLVLPWMRLGSGALPPGEPSGWEDIVEAVREDGGTIRRRSRAWYDVANQLEHTETRYELLVGDEVIATEDHRRSPATRDYTLGQAQALVASAGFDTVQVTSGWSGEPARADDLLFVIIAQRGARPDPSSGHRAGR